MFDILLSPQCTFRWFSLVLLVLDVDVDSFVVK